MKMNMLVIAILFLCSSTNAQDARTNKTQMKMLSYMIGSWKGSATITQQGGAPIKVEQEEKISWQLDSLLINVEGIGKDPVTNKKTFHAVALVYYNNETNELAMKSFTHEGRQTDAYFKVIAENKFEWGFDLKDNRGKIKYNILLSVKDKTWIEKGEFSPDGTKWYPFMEMNLTKL